MWFEPLTVFRHQINNVEYCKDDTAQVLTATAVI
jgi:hypothetical protein